MLGSGRPVGWALKETLPELKQPLGRSAYVPLAPHGMRSTTAALAHAAAEPIFEKPSGQALVLAAPSNPAHNGARNGPPARPPRNAAHMRARHTRVLGAMPAPIERACAQLRSRCVSYDGNIAQRAQPNQVTTAMVSSTRPHPHARTHWHGRARLRAQRGSTAGEGFMGGPASERKG